MLIALSLAALSSISALTHAQDVAAKENLPITVCTKADTKELVSIHHRNPETSIFRSKIESIETLVNYLTAKEPVLSNHFQYEIMGFTEPSVYTIEPLTTALSRGRLQATSGPCAPGEEAYDIDAFPAPAEITAEKIPLVMELFEKTDMRLGDAVSYVSFKRGLKHYLKHPADDKLGDTLYVLTQTGATTQDFYAALTALSPAKDEQEIVQAILEKRFRTVCVDYFGAIENCLAFFQDAKTLSRYPFKVTPEHVNAMTWRGSVGDSKNRATRMEILTLADLSDDMAFVLSDFFHYEIDRKEFDLVMSKLHSIRFDAKDINLVLSKNSPELIAAYFEKLQAGALSILSADDMSSLVLSFSHRWSDDQYRAVIEAGIKNGLLFSPLAMGSIKRFKPESYPLVENLKSSAAQTEFLKPSFRHPEQLYCLVDGMHGSLPTDLFERRRYFNTKFELKADLDALKVTDAFHHEVPLKGEFKIPTPWNKKKSWTVKIEGIDTKTLMEARQQSVIVGTYKVSNSRGKPIGREIQIDLPYSILSYDPTAAFSDFVAMQYMNFFPKKRAIVGVYCFSTAETRDSTYLVAEGKNKELVELAKFKNRIKRWPGNVGRFFKELPKKLKKKKKSDSASEKA